MADNSNHQHQTSDVHESQVKVSETQNLVPPIESIVLPKTATKSALIRWCREMGYTVKEVSNHLGIKYQMVRNIWTTAPKRMAREDLPPLEFVYRDEVDDVQLLMDHDLDRSLEAVRKERLKEARDQRRADREAGVQAEDE